MAFNRKWDASCPRVYDRWEADGVTWVVQDLAPEDDDEALRLLMEQLIPDELLGVECNFEEDPPSLRSSADFWMQCLKQRMSLACYAEGHSIGKKTLVAVNCIVVASKGEKIEPDQLEGKAWNDMCDIMSYISQKFDAIEFLGLDKVLKAHGLVVKREFRGMQLGTKLLAARELLGLSHGIKGTCTLFTGTASQKSASRAGYKTVYQITLRELADAGFNITGDDRELKTMVKKYS